VANDLSTEDRGSEPPIGIDPRAARVVVVALLLAMGACGLTYSVLRERAGPPPAEIAADGLLVEGRELYLSRCVSCHGPAGKGDGPIAHSLTGPPPGDLTDQTWKHGERPEDVLRVISLGVQDTSMSGWAGTYSAQQLRMLAAYVFYLAGRPVPETLRQPGQKR
jgi:cytochrome c oxidase cbb3-type subunit III